jgi:hypothetical protein
MLRAVQAQVFEGEETKKPKDACGFYVNSKGKLYWMHPRDAFLVSLYLEPYCP